MDFDTGIRLWRWGNAVSCFGVAQFLCLCAMAMVAYPGGTIVDRHTTGYSFTENFLSDLGMTMSWSVEPNGTASLLFNTAMVVLGLSIIPFFLFMPTHAPDQTESLRIAGVVGVISSLALVGIGLTPFDIRPRAHEAALVLWLMSLSGAAVLHFGALWASKTCSSLLAAPSLGLVIVVTLYMVLAAGFGVEAMFGAAPEVLRRSVIMQKYLVLYTLVWYTVFAVRMACTTVLRPPDRDLQLRREVADYLKRLHGRRLGVKPGGPAAITPPAGPQESRPDKGGGPRKR